MLAVYLLKIFDDIFRNKVTVLVVYGMINYEDRLLNAVRVCEK